MQGLNGPEAYRRAAMGPQSDLFSAEPPVMAAWGMGVDSTAMIIETLSRQERLDVVLSSDTGDERESTYSFRDLFMDWLKSNYGIEVVIVRYQPKNFKNFPEYKSLFENCLTNGTLPSIAFGFGSCSLKFKVGPQDTWTNNWEPAKRIWSAGGRVIKLIGYDAGPRDSARYAQRVDDTSSKYLFRTPLREWGWDRAACERRIAEAGLPVPPKSSCFYCTASKPDEIRLLSKPKLARIVAMEARAQPRLKSVVGLWRSPVRGGYRGSVARPGRMTDFIRSEKLLPADVIDRIEDAVPKSLVAFLESTSTLPLEERPGLKAWLDFFIDCENLGLDDGAEDRVYAGPRDRLLEDRLIALSTPRAPPSNPD